MVVQRLSDNDVFSPKFEFHRMGSLFRWTCGLGLKNISDNRHDLHLVDDKQGFKAAALEVGNVSPCLSNLDIRSAKRLPVNGLF